MAYYWKFNKMRPSDKTREPIQGEFFATDAISNPGEALIREGIQNSLDARQGDEKVRVRIRLSGIEHAVDRSIINPFLSGLNEHLQAPRNGLRDIPQDSDKCSFLVFEDYGTSGLIGDPAEWKPESGSSNHFYHFFRAEGRSDKGEKDIGRWGVGKQVFPRSSRINIIFGLTVRQDDKKKLLMGMAILKSHDVNGVRYAPDGLFGCPPENNDEGLVLPIEDSQYIESFSKAFDIQRSDEPGLTIVVPWCDTDLTHENLVRAVLKGYFWPILQDKLEVVVEMGERKTVLNSISMETEIKNIGNDIEREVLPLVELAKWANQLIESDFVMLSMPDKNRALQWSTDLFPKDALNEVHRRFDNGDRIAIRVPVNIRQNKQPERVSYFHVFLHRGGKEHNGRPVFIRDGIIIPDVRAPRTRGVRSLVNAEDDPIAAFLGDSENPAHTQWQHDGDNFRGKYKSGKTDLEFVKNSVHQIVNIICGQDNKIDRSLLMDVFSIPASPDDLLSRAREEESKGGGNEPEKPKTPLAHRTKPLIIEQVENGFAVLNNKKGESLSGKDIQIRAAYQVRNGNPFNKYRPTDFDMRSLNVNLSGGSVVEENNNTLRLRINNGEFRVEVKGFDSKRDVRVDVEVLEVNNDD